MECNKDEAIRARDIAEKKMQNKDFSGALRIAAKAQRLFQDLENIAQMILVCDVHCAAEKRLYGDVMDWYGILKVAPKDDEATIKKQYRKFALQLHPDKNRFPGAEAAFMLIGDAQRTLLDQGKRYSHDMKHKVAVSRPSPAAACQPPQNPNRFAHATAQNNFHANFPGLKTQQQQPPTQTGFSNGRPTFWTKCPHCTVKYQYHMETLNRCIRCQTCCKSFFALDSGVVSQGSKMSQPKFPQQGVAHNQGSSRVDQGGQRSFTTENVFTAFTPNAARTSEPATRKVNGKRGRKQTVESSESSSESEEDMVTDDVTVGKKFNSQVEKNVRRSGRHKQRVSYNENLSDEEKISESPGACEQTKELKEKQPDEMKEDRKPVKAYVDGLKEKSNPIVDDSVPDLSFKEMLYECPEPEFYNFDNDKKENCFSVGQIWALYDTLDAMPRFYARIIKILSSGFKMRITWLEPDPDDADEIEWVSEGLPVSCGKFKHGASENIEDRLMFSHLLYREEGTSRDTYKIFPRKGETWALFKNWNIDWKTGAGTDQKYKYEFVEILSEGAEGGGIQVAYLTKVKGFVSVFCQTSKNGIDTILIPPNELFRFSHKVPSFELTVEERGVPKGSFELDTASLPEAIVVPNDLMANDDSRHLGSSCSSASKIPKPMVGSDEPAPPASTSKTLEIPESEFYNFDADKSPEKFHDGQVWALYCDDDGLPKYYGQIMKIESRPVFKIHVAWLLPCPSETRTEWNDKNMPTCCGRFRVRKGSQVYSSTDSFSHKLKAYTTDLKNEYSIVPGKGEIWALYRNWSPEIKCSDLENWRYDIVLVMEETQMSIKVMNLEREDGYNSVFKVKGGSNVSAEISRVEMLRFSHQIPFFELTKEKNGSLRGCWELDPAALPVHYYFS